jgi:1,2-diacylglycerol 3-alpha-glucosyltransferase
MHVGLVSACYKPVINGVTRMVTLYQTRLQQAGEQVTVFTLGKPNQRREEEGIIRSPGLPLGSTGYYVSLGYSEQARRELAKTDILHCHHLFMSLEMAHRYGRCPIVYTNHTRYDLYTSAYTPLPQQAADAIMRLIWPQFTDLCDAIIAPSRSIRDILIGFGVRRPIVVIENGIDLDRFHAPPAPMRKGQLGVASDSCLAVYLGRLSAEKRVDRLLVALAGALVEAPNLHLLVIGDGPLRQALTRLARELAVADAVTFAGSVPQDSVGDWLAAADFFVTASTSEVHPLSVIEAMASGLPVAAVRSPGLMDTVADGETGVLVDEGDATLVGAMANLALNPNACRAMGAAARAASSRFGIDITVGKSLDLYRDLLESGPWQRDDHHRQRQADRLLRLRPMAEKLGGLLHPSGKRGVT